LTVFLETGIFGLMAFVWILISIIDMTITTYKRAVSDIDRIISGATFVATIGLIFGAFFHDVFKPVILNELWWSFVGLTAAVYKLQNKATEIDAA